MPGSTRSYEMARRLVSMGHQVDIITSTRNFEVKDKGNITIDDGIKIHWIKVDYSNKMHFWSRVLSFLKFAFLAFFKAKKLNADIIFASSTPLTISIPGILVSRLKGIPFCFEVRDLWPEIPIAMGYLKNPFLRFFALKLEKFSYKNSKGIVALSEGMKEGIVRKGYSEEKIVVIPNGADLDSFDYSKEFKNNIRIKFGFSNNDVIVLYPGTFGHVNNLDYLINLANKFINHNNIKFILVGDGNENDYLVNKSKNLNLFQKIIFFYNKVPKNQISDFFSMSDIVISTVLPLKELEANCANKFFDALASGTCMIINHGGWQEDELVKYNCGFRLSRNIEEAYEKLKFYSNNPNILYEMGKNARFLAETKYSREILSKDLAQFLKSKII